MRYSLFTLIFCLGLVLALVQVQAAPSTYAAADSNSFNVTKLLSTETEDGNIGDVVDDKTITERFLEFGEAEGTSGVGAVILRAINILSLLVGTFGVILMIIAGFMLATAQGEQSRIDRGKAIITQALGGILIAFFSYMIVTLIQSFFY